MNFSINGQRVFKSTGKFTKKEAKQAEANEKQKMLNEEKMTPQERAAKTLLLMPSTPGAPLIARTRFYACSMFSRESRHSKEEATTPTISKTLQPGDIG